ncbi:MAG: phosphoribosylanthranilate isomerase, partial [Raineya sp.]
MKVKVCGMRDEENIKEVAELTLDYFGFIFYEQSPRFVGNNNKNLSELLKNIHQEKVGVFVNASIDCILEKIQAYQLNLVQLHGGEAVDFCKDLKENLSENNIQI